MKYSCERERERVCWGGGGDVVTVVVYHSVCVCVLAESSVHIVSMVVWFWMGCDVVFSR